jgi:hypothetical protein
MDTEQGVAHLWQTQRKLVTKSFDDAKKPYIVSTKPLFSTLSLPADVVLPTDYATNKYAFAVFRKGTVLDWFSYGIGDTTEFGADERKATPADTNISKSKQTNGAATFVIEGLSAHCRGMYAKDQALSPTGVAPFPPTSDPDVAAAIAGKRIVADPGSIFLVPQQYSPFNLENVLMQAIAGSMSLDITWDEDRFERIGTLFYTPQGGGGSELRSHGIPLSTNVAKVPEGYVWARQGVEDSELVVRGTLQNSVIVPITLNDDPDDDTKICAPSNLYMDLVLKLHGFEFKYPSRN